MENSNRIKDGNWRLVLGSAEVRRSWKEYYEDLYNIDTQEEVTVLMSGFDEVRRGNYFGGEPIRKTEVEVKVGKFRNEKAAGKDVVTEMIKGGGNRVVGWIWRLCNMALESDVVPEEWRSALILPLYKGKVERTECSNYRGISLLSVVGKIYAWILVDKVRKVTESLIDDEQRGFRAGRVCVDQIFTLKQIGEKAREKKLRVYVGFMNLEKAYDKDNREALWQVLRMYVE